MLANALSAWQRPEIAALREALLSGVDGPATVPGRRAGAPAGLAAFVLALPVAAEQRQDGHRRARGHPASHVVPAVLAVAGGAGPGRAFRGAASAAAGAGPGVTAAVLTGYETGVRVGRAMGGTRDGVHDIGTWGTVGAAAGVAHLLTRGDPDAVAAAIDLAAVTPSIPDAGTVFGGSTGQHLLLAGAAQAGVTAGIAAASGLRAPAGTLERHFLAVAGRAPVPIDPAPGTYEVLAGYVKRHPTMAHLHGVNDAVEDLLPLDPATVARVEVATYAGAAAFADPLPANDLAARFSIPYSVAAAIVTGEAGPSPGAPEAAIRALAQRVVVRSDPLLDNGYPDGRPAVVTVELTDGTRRSARAARPRGDGEGALTAPGVREKPRRLLAAAIGSEAADAVVFAVDSLDTHGVQPLLETLRGLQIRPQNGER